MTEAEKLAAGDESAWASAFAALRARSIWLASKCVGRDDAEDVVMTAFATAWKNRDRYRGDANFATFVHAVVVNAALTEFRSRRSNKRAGTVALAPDFDVESGEPDAERVERAKQAVALIDPLDLPLLEAKYVDGETAEAIARKLGVTRNAAKIRIFRARQNARKAIGAAWT